MFVHYFLIFRQTLTPNFKKNVFGPFYERLYIDVSNYSEDFLVVMLLGLAYLQALSSVYTEVSSLKSIMA